MSLLYKDKFTTTVEIAQKRGKVSLYFEADIGKHGVEEPIDFYKLTPSRLLVILQKEDNYTDEELEE